MRCIVSKSLRQTCCRTRHGIEVPARLGKRLSCQPSPFHREQTHMLVDHTQRSPMSTTRSMRAKPTSWPTRHLRCWSRTAKRTAFCSTSWSRNSAGRNSAVFGREARRSLHRRSSSRTRQASTPCLSESNELRTMLGFKTALCVASSSATPTRAGRMTVVTRAFTLSTTCAGDAKSIQSHFTFFKNVALRTTSPMRSSQPYGLTLPTRARSAVWRRSCDSRQCSAITSRSRTACQMLSALLHWPQVCTMQGMSQIWIS